MNTRRTSGTPPSRPHGRTLPRSPSEALEPTRGPSRPRGNRRRREVRKLSPALRTINAFLTLSAVGLLLASAAILWLDREFAKAGPLTAEKTVVIPRGIGVRAIAQRLENEGVVSSQQLFMGYYVSRIVQKWFGGKDLQLKAGTYRFEPGQSLRSVAAEVGTGRSVLAGITIPEGLTSFQIVERLRADTTLTGEIEMIPPEGSLMPDTYKVPEGMSRSAVLALMKTEMQEALEKAWAARQSDLPLKSPQEALVLASIVEKETGRKGERAEVAGVFINRLKRGMRLQSDPTILYGLFGGQTTWGKPILRSEIRSQTAHNTYQIDGLPPTPICNPGRAAIEAVLSPAQTSNLFFVADGTGGHIYTETLKDHNAAVANWRKIEREIRAREAANAKTRAVSREAPPPAGAAGERAQPATLKAEVTEAPEDQTAATTRETDTPGNIVDMPLPIRKPPQ